MKANIRILALSVALAAMALRALVPSGWMPDAGSHLLTLCTINGKVEIIVGADGQPTKQMPARDGEHQLCPFAGSPILASASATPLLVMSTLVSVANLLPPRLVIASANRHAPQSPRAPPVLS